MNEGFQQMIVESRVILLFLVHYWLIAIQLNSLASPHKKKVTSVRIIHSFCNRTGSLEKQNVLSSVSTTALQLFVSEDREKENVRAPSNTSIHKNNTKWAIKVFKSNNAFYPWRTLTSTSCIDKKNQKSAKNYNRGSDWGRRNPIHDMLHHLILLLVGPLWLWVLPLLRHHLPVPVPLVPNTPLLEHGYMAQRPA